ncbi:MAG TPA: hypothetical protein PKZ39_04430 [Clostridia bacterium]|nr:hypothetical protein [Clostridia bacterium]
MSTRKFFPALFMAALLLLPATALATTVDLPEFGVVLHFPASLDVFTRSMDMDDPVPALYGTTPQAVREELAGAGLYAKAYDVAGAFTITLALKYTDQPALDSLDTEGLRQAARALGGEEYELVGTRQGSFLLVREQGGKAASALFQGGRLWMKLRLQAGSHVDSGMLSLLRGILRQAEFALGQ